MRADPPKARRSRCSNWCETAPSARAEDHLQGAEKESAIRWSATSRALGIDPTQLHQEVLGARVGLELLPHLARNRGHRAQAVTQRAKIEAAPADDDWQPSSSADRLDGVSRPAGELSRRVALARVENVEEVMRHSFSLFAGGLSGADLQPAIGLQRIGVDDLGGQLTGYRERQGALADTGGSDDGGKPGEHPSSLAARSLPDGDRTWQRNPESP